jgi:hypothetical protein
VAGRAFPFSAGHSIFKRDGEKLELGLTEGVEVRRKDRAEITQARALDKIPGVVYKEQS